MQHRDRFERDGYVVIEGLLPRDEALALRHTVLALADEERRGGTLQSNPEVPTLRWMLGDLLAKPGLAHLVFDQRILACVRALLGPRIAYFGDSFVQLGEGFRDLHKDCVDRLDPAGPDWRGRYPIARFTLYLQDNLTTSGGLKVRRGSHRFADFSSGRLEHVPSRLGDMVAMKLTTTHAGNAVRPRFLPWLALPSAIEDRLPSLLRAPGGEQRVGLFLTYAAPGPELDRYLANYVRGGGNHAHWRRCRADAQIAARAAEHDIVWLKPIPDYGASYSAQG